MYIYIAGQKQDPAAMYIYIYIYNIICCGPDIHSTCADPR